MKNMIKNMIRRVLGWYVNPVYQQNEKLQHKLYQIEANLKGISLDLADCKLEVRDNRGLAEQAKALFYDIGERIQVSEEQMLSLHTSLKNQEMRLEAIEVRAQTMQDCIKEQDIRFVEIERQEQWTRERFEDQDVRFAAIENREQWARERFENQDTRFAAIESREQWTRDRFEQHDVYLHELENKIADIQKSISRDTDCHIAKQENENTQQMTFAQSGEDAIVAYLLRFLQKPVPEITYLDLGANHAKELSNTYYFYKMGARGVLLEANPELIPELEKERAGDVILNRAVGLDNETKTDFFVLSGDGLSTISLEDAQKACEKNPELCIRRKYEIETIQINDLLHTYFEKAPTILSIDLEGIEENILTQIDFERYGPWIIILENIPYTPLLSIDQREYKCVNFLNGKGYTEYAFTGINSIFVHRKVVEKFNETRLRQLEGDRGDG